MVRPALTSFAAIFSVLAASSCCLPVLPLIAAAGLAGGSTFLWAARPYLLGASLFFVALGFLQAARARKCDRRPNRAGYLLLWFSALVVAGSIVLPALASGGVRTPAGQLPLADLNPHTAADLRSAFNADAADARVLAFLSPT